MIRPSERATISNPTDNSSVALTPASFKFTKGKDKPSRLPLDTGKTEWIKQGVLIENTGGAPAELMRFDIKTKPLKKEQLKPREHAHR